MRSTGRLDSAQIFRVAEVLAAVALCLIFILHAWIISFSYPQADDLCFGAEAKGSLIKALGVFYTQWNGRLLANFIGLLPHYMSKWTGADVVETHRWLLWTNMALLFAAMSVIGGIFFPRANIVVRLRETLLWTVLFLLTAYSTKEGFYWLSGAASYLFGFFFFAVALRWAVRLAQGQIRNPAILAVPGGAIIIAAMFHEVYAIALVMLYGSIALGWFWKRGNARVAWTAAMLASIAFACFLAIALSPGTTARMGHIGTTGHGEVIRTLALGGFASFTVFFEITGLATLAFLVHVFTTRLANADSPPRDGVSPLWVWLPLIGTLPVCLLLGFYSTGVPLPARALNVVQLWVLVGLAGLVTLGADRFRVGQSTCQQMIRARLRKPTGRYLPFLFVAVVLLFDRGVPIAVRDGFVEGPRFAQSMADRFTRLRGPGQDVVLPPLDQDSRLLLIGEQEYRPRGFLNKCAARYFGKSSVRLALPRSK